MAKGGQRKLLMGRGKNGAEATAAERRPRTRRWRDGEVAGNTSALPCYTGLVTRSTEMNSEITKPRNIMFPVNESVTFLARTDKH